MQGCIPVCVAWPMHLGWGQPRGSPVLWALEGRRGLRSSQCSKQPCTGLIWVFKEFFPRKLMVSENKIREHPSTIQLPSSERTWVPLAGRTPQLPDIPRHNTHGHSTGCSNRTQAERFPPAPLHRGLPVAGIWQSRSKQESQCERRAIRHEHIQHGQNRA